MSLLTDIQDGAVGTDLAVSALLRKCKILSVRLKSDQLSQWVDWELGGYPSPSVLPDYRRFRVRSFGHFVGSGGRQLRNAPIPPMCFTEEIRELLTTFNATDPISTFESFLRDSGGREMQVEWPPDTVVLARDLIRSDMSCMQAWQSVPNSWIASLVDTVRTRVLNFVLEIQEEAPDAGEAAPGVEPIPKERVNQVFNTYILGNVGAVASGAGGITDSMFSITPGNLADLTSALKEVGLADDDLRELSEAIDKDPEQDSGFGDRVRAWMGKMFAKTVDGTWRVSVAVASNILTRALNQYYGLE